MTLLMKQIKCRKLAFDSVNAFLFIVFIFTIIIAFILRLNSCCFYKFKVFCFKDARQVMKSCQDCDQVNVLTMFLRSI